MTVTTPPAPAQSGLSPFETGPGTPAGQYLRSFWQPIRVSDSLPAGIATPIKVMGERFNLYRGASGEPHLTEPGCPHRQTMLSLGNVEDDSIRCIFHGWKFGPDGRCEEAPGQGPKLVERQKIKTYPVHEEYGVIFAYLGEGEPPAFHDIAGFSKKYGRDMSSALVHDTATYQRRCNYYINVENALDLAHVVFTHKLSSDPTITEVGFDPGVIRVRDVTVERLEFGIRAVEIEHENEPMISTVMLPNAMHLMVPRRDGWLEQVGWRVPIDDELHYSIQITAVHTDEEGRKRYEAYKARKADLIAKYPSTDECAEAILRGEKTLYDYADHPELVNIEDHVAQMGMQWIDEPGKENLAQSDKAVLQLRRMFISRMGDFLAGTPTGETDW